MVVEDDSAPIPSFSPTGRIEAGWLLEVEGDFQFAAEKCFVDMFAPGLSCKYFTCETCDMNWVCESCANSCHSGHTLRVFTETVPTYAACYCGKKNRKNCELRKRK